MTKLRVHISGKVYDFEIVNSVWSSLVEILIYIAEDNNDSDIERVIDAILNCQKGQFVTIVDFDLPKTVKVSAETFADLMAMEWISDSGVVMIRVAELIRCMLIKTENGLKLRMLRDIISNHKDYIKVLNAE